MHSFPTLICKILSAPRCSAPIPVARNFSAKRSGWGLCRQSMSSDWVCSIFDPGCFSAYGRRRAVRGNSSRLRSFHWGGGGAVESVVGFTGRGTLFLALWKDKPKRDPKQRMESKRGESSRCTAKMEDFRSDPAGESGGLFSRCKYRPGGVGIREKSRTIRR